MNYEYYTPEFEIPSEYTDLLSYCRKYILKCALAGRFITIEPTSNRARELRNSRLIDTTEIVKNYFKSRNIWHNYPVITKYGVGYLKMHGIYIWFKSLDNYICIKIGIANNLKYQYVYNMDTEKFYIVACGNDRCYYYNMITLEMVGF